MAGMFCDFAWSISGALAFESSAAKPSASGFFCSALVSIVTCCSMSCSVGGPSNVILAPSFWASSSAPFLTACQNWCWKPLETIAMYGCSPPPPLPPPADLLPESLSDPQAATASASPAAPTASHLLETMTPPLKLTEGAVAPSRLPHLSRALARHVGVDRDEDHRAEDHVLPLLRNRHDLQPVVEDRDDQGADDRADDRALAAGQRRAADDHGGDRLQLVAEPRAGLGGREPGRDHHAGQPREQPGERVDDQLPAAHADARQRRRLLVGADRVRVAPEDGLVEHDGRDHRGHGEHEHGVGEVHA